MAKFSEVLGSTDIDQSLANLPKKVAPGTITKTVETSPNPTSGGFETKITNSQQVRFEEKKAEGTLPKKPVELRYTIPGIALVDQKTNKEVILKKGDVLLDQSGKALVITALDQRVFERTIFLEDKGVHRRGRIEDAKKGDGTWKLNVTFYDSGETVALDIPHATEKNDATLKESNTMATPETINQEANAQKLIETKSEKSKTAKEMVGMPLEVLEKEYKGKTYMRGDATNGVTYTVDWVNGTRFGMTVVTEMHDGQPTYRIGKQFDFPIEDLEKNVLSGKDVLLTDGEKFIPWKEPKENPSSQTGKKNSREALPSNITSDLAHGNRIWFVEDSRKPGKMIQIDSVSPENGTFTFTIEGTSQKGTAKISTFEKYNAEGRANKVIDDTPSVQVAQVDATPVPEKAAEAKNQPVKTIEQKKENKKLTPEEEKIAFLEKEIERYKNDTSISENARISAVHAFEGARIQVLNEIQAKKNEEVLSGVRQRDQLRLQVDSRVAEILSTMVGNSEKILASQKEQENELKKIIVLAEKTRMELEDERTTLDVKNDKRRIDYLALATLQQREFIEEKSAELTKIQADIAESEKKLAEHKAKLEDTTTRVAILKKSLGEDIATIAQTNTDAPTTQDQGAAAVPASIEIPEDKKKALEQKAEQEAEKKVVDADAQQKVNSIVYGVRKFNEPVPEVAPQNAEKIPTPEEALNASRDAYIAAYKEFMDERRKINGGVGGFMKKLGRFVTFRRDTISYDDVPELGEKLRDAEALYSGSKEKYAGVLLAGHLENLRASITAQPGTPEYQEQFARMQYPFNKARGEVFQKMIVGEQEKINQLKIESLPARKKMLITKLLDKYRSLPPAKRLAVAALIAAASAGTGAVLAGASAVTVGGVAFTGAKLGALRSTLGMTAGATVGGAFKLKDKLTGNTPQSRAEARTLGLENDYVLGKYVGKWAQLENDYRAIIEKEQKENRKRALIRGIAVAGASFSAARWGTQLIEGFGATPPAPIVTPEHTPHIVPPPETGPLIKETIVTFNHGDGGIKAFEHLQSQLKIQYAGIDANQIPNTVKEIIGGDPTKLSIKFGMYDPNAASGAESALLHEGGHMGIDKFGNLYYQDAGESSSHILENGPLRGGAAGQWTGKMFDSDHNTPGQGTNNQWSDAKMQEMLRGGGGNGAEAGGNSWSDVKMQQMLHPGLAETQAGIHTIESPETLRTIDHPDGIEATPEALQEQSNHVYEKILDKSFASTGPNGGILVHGEQSPMWIKLKDMDARTALTTYKNMDVPGPYVVDAKMKPFLTDLGNLYAQTNIEPNAGEALGSYMRRAVEALVKKGI
jgi:hypothetical protein